MRSDVAAALESEVAATSSSTSSSMRRSSEQSTISSTSSFNASTKSSLTKSTRIHRHHRHGRIESTLAGHASSIPASSTLNSSSTSSSCETSLSRSATKKTVSSSSSSLVSKAAASANNRGDEQRRRQGHQLALLHNSKQECETTANQAFDGGGSSSWIFRPAGSQVAGQYNLLLSSPDGELGSLVMGLDTDLAELESMTISSHRVMRDHFVAGRRSRHLDSELPHSSRLRIQARRPSASSPPSPPPNSGPDSLEALMSETNSTIRDLEDNPPSLEGGELLALPSTSPLGSDRAESPSSLNMSTATANEAKIRDLMERTAGREGAQLRPGSAASGKEFEVVAYESQPAECLSSAAAASSSARSPLNESAAVKGKIEKIDQRMNDLCRKLKGCRDTQRTAELLKIMIQTIEKAWSIPFCGDSLGFNLCSSLRQSGSLRIILGFIVEASGRQLLPQAADESGGQQQAAATDSSEKLQTGKSIGPEVAQERNQTGGGGNAHPKATKQLKLNLSKLQLEQNRELKQLEGERAHQSAAQPDEDSDILTSDLGQDSTTSLESLSYVSAVANVSPTAAKAAEAEDADQSGSEAEQRSRQEADEAAAAAMQADELEELRQAREEELVLLSAHLLSQCLTSENRDYIVRTGLDPVIELACQFATMKSKHSKRLLKRSALIRRSSKLNQQQQQHELSKGSDKTDGTNSEEEASTLTSIATSNNTSPTTCDTAAATGPIEQTADEQQTDTRRTSRQQQPASGAAGQTEAGAQQPGAEHPERSDLHSAIGTEILQHLFKHSEETCSRMINLGALQAILYGCRSSHTETLRHCASALANLALYGGPDGQQTMIEQKAHVWLFPLAFNEDDNVQYYACLAIVVLAANQEIEADVIKSSTLDLVEPFVTSHEPRKFAESTTSHIHGQSGAWLGKLMPLLDSKREEARNLACFHFAMEAYIKHEQNRTQLFKEIESIEPLRRAGSSPIAIASKFACQALRLIGEPEPHKLSQQVPLWSCEDVCVWVSQIGFERFVSAFRDSHVDGDLLLQLDEEMLKFDIGISNGIIRRRFLRELSHLKRIADYSSVDRSNLGQLLINTTSLLLPSCCSMPGNNVRPHAGPNVAAGRGGPGQQAAGSAPRQANHALHCCSTTKASGAVVGSQQARSARDYLQYIYPIIQLGVTRDNIHLVDCDHLLAECKITNALHRVKLANSIRELQDRVMMEAASQERNSLIGGAEEKTLDVFVSYRRSNGSQLASLLKVHLQLRGFSVFIDVERLEAGKFDNNLLESIRLARNFILVLSPNALDRCIGDHECKDWIHKEIVAALASGCNIIPIFDNQFHWPDGEQLPEDMRSITYFNGIRWSHDYQDASVDKIERFIRGELNNSSASQTTTSVVGVSPFTLSIASGVGSLGSSQQGNTTSQYQRFGSQTAGLSTPSLVSSTPSLCGPQTSQPAPHFNPLTSGVNSASTVATAVVVGGGKHDYQNVSDSNDNTEPTSKPLTINYPTGHTLEVNPNVRLR